MPIQENQQPLRVFISYSHEDAILAEKIVKAFIANGITPMWDKISCMDLVFMV